MGRAKSMARRPKLDNTPRRLAKKNPKSHHSSTSDAATFAVSMPTPSKISLPDVSTQPPTPPMLLLPGPEVQPPSQPPAGADTTVNVWSSISMGMLGTSSLPSLDIRSEVLGSKGEQVNVENREGSSEANRNILDVVDKIVVDVVTDPVNDDTIRTSDPKDASESDDGDDDGNEAAGDSEENGGENESEKGVDIPQPPPVVEKSGSDFEDENLGHDDASDTEEVEIEAVEVKRKGKGKLEMPRRK